jgi:ComF family protein
MYKNFILNNLHYLIAQRVKINNNYPELEKCIDTNRRFKDGYRIKGQKLPVMLSDLMNLFYPLTCTACDRVLLYNEYLICTSCLYRLPRTNFTGIVDNPVARLFWGRVNLTYATALYHFHKGGRLQHMIHKLKYKGNYETGLLLGSLLGHELRHSYFNKVDIIIPVPMHKQRMKKRGYNQSELIAIGISRIMKKPLDTVSCLRTVRTETQTNKSRFERWQNVEGIFAITDAAQFRFRHILLVDDVVTTGATLEACAHEFLKIEGAKVSIAAVAVADMML